MSTCYQKGPNELADDEDQVDVIAMRKSEEAELKTQLSALADLKKER